MKKKYLFVLIPMSLAAIGFNCGGEKKEIAKIKIDESAIAVKLVNVEQGEYSLPVISSGLMGTETESRLSFKVPGIIQKIYVKEGDAITKGQLLASLDLTEINAQVSQTKNGLDKATRDFERGKRLFKDSAATLEQFQNLQTALNVAQENYHIASFNKQFATIHALASGKVIKKFLNEGEVASPGMPVLVVNTSGQSSWVVKVGLPDVDWVRVKAGDTVTITTDAYPGTEFTGDLSSVNEGAEPVTGLYQAEVKIHSGNKKLASGLVAKVKIQPSEKQKLWSVPIETIVEGQGTTGSVFVVQPDGKSVKKVQVQISYLENQKAFVSAGLEGISQVVLAGSAFLTEKSVVSITKN